VPLHKYVTAEGERRVSVRDDGQQAISLFKPLAAGDTASMLDIRLMTGRTHQIRVHAAHVGHPILGDDKYGDFDLNRALVKQGVKRLFLHARQLSLSHPLSGEPLSFVSPLPTEMQRFLDTRINAPT
ncbi:MAG: pseudouridine synthase, partial [Proteobacteria bacterium]|nr:pseudouridine synthase [Pseudomonadota bacterium]